MKKMALILFLFLVLVGCNQSREQAKAKDESQKPSSKVEEGQGEQQVVEAKEEAGKDEAVKTEDEEKAAQGPFKFNYRAIPFGDTVENVLKRVEGAQVKEAEDADFQVAGNYKLDSHFQGGLYVNKFLGTTCFNSRVARSFTVKHDGWENIKEINLFFTKGFGSNNSGNLFLVEKTLKTPEGNMENVFNGMAGQISKELGLSPTIHQVAYLDFQMKVHGDSHRPALVAVWLLKDRKVFLLLRNDVFYLGDPKILYLSNKEWQTYMDSCNAFEKEKEKEAGKGAKDF